MLFCKWYVLLMVLNIVFPINSSYILPAYYYLEPTKQFLVNELAFIRFIMDLAIVESK